LGQPDGFWVSVENVRLFIQKENTLKYLLKLLDYMPRRFFFLISAACVALLVFGLYLQHFEGLEPCPMCIVQRYALILIAVCAALTGVGRTKGVFITGGLLQFVLASSGAFVAARQSWLQWYPPEVASCGRDLYGMIETFPLQRLVPMIFRGGGDCSKIDWTFLGGTIANWSFLWFCAMAVAALLVVWRQIKVR
jgi:disulfide bond formation protein DsbB